MVRIKQLAKVFASAEVETTALNDIDMRIESGEFVAVMGPSGCGKSTLLNVIGLLDNPTSGEYFFLDQEISSFSERKLVKLRKENIGFVFQNFNLIEELTVFDNVELPLLYHDLGRKERRKLVEVVLERMDLSQRRNHYPKELSGGQQQRVAVARAVVTEPKLLLADEPTGNLDTKNGERVMSMLLELNRAGTTVLMVTHSQNQAEYGTRVLSMLDGHLVSDSLL